MVLNVEYAEYKKLKLLKIRMVFDFLESQADHFFNKSKKENS